MIGAAGAVGGYAMQLAKAAGLTVIADAAERDRDLVAALGADHLVPRGDGFADAVLRVAATFAPEDVAQAHTFMEAGGVRGRPVIVF
ncbi:hypothetical protein [Micromonospora coriariae]|uniref:hypothetical protein n=1 Tax=Micromonospora coriariae TaxID=285665 RepID=UPI0018D4E6B1|nr:hypothetical protein [Micromonospora coriariae]